MPGAIDDFVAALGRRLRGPRRLKRDLLAEARDGLIDAAEALEAAGLGRAEAERRAVAEFGEVAEVAPGYRAELTARQGRHTAALVFLSVPATTLMWSELWRGYPWDPASLTATPAWFLPLARLIDWLQILTGVAGGLALLAFGHLARRAGPSAQCARPSSRAGASTLPIAAVNRCQAERSPARALRPAEVRR